MKNSRIVRVALLLVLIAVSAGVFYQAKESMTTDFEKSDLILNSDREVHRNRSRYVYEADVKDPFLLVKPVARIREPQKHAVKPQVWAPPPFTLNGIVLNGARRVAVLGSANGDAFFLSEGDSLKGLVIRKIDKDSVFFSYAGQKKSWGVR